MKEDNVGPIAREIIELIYCDILYAQLFLIDESILVKLYTLVIHNWKICMKEDNLGPKTIMGDIYLCRTWVITLCDLTHSSSMST